MKARVPISLSTFPNLEINGFVNRRTLYCDCGVLNGTTRE